MQQRDTRLVMLTSAYVNWDVDPRKEVTGWRCA